MAKEKRYYWLKFKRDFFDDLRIRKLQGIPGGDTYVLAYIKILTFSIPTSGIIIYQGIFETIEEEIALEIREDPKTIRFVLEYASNHGMLEGMEQGKFYLPYAAENIGSEGASAQRMRKLRFQKDAAKQLPSSQCDASVTESDKKVTTEKENKRKEIEKEKEPLSIVSLQNFDSFVSHIRAKYTNQLIVERRDKHTDIPIAISVSSSGRLYNLRTGEDFPGSRAKELWSSLFNLYKEGKLQIINHQKGEIA
jgi:predicted phage replisome organizer